MMFSDLLLWWAVRVEPGTMWVAAFQFGVTLALVAAVAWYDREGETE
jgi:hypothetical protein